jgi:hypothetical protein
MNLSPITQKLIRSTVSLGTDFLRLQPDTPFVCWKMRALGVARDNWATQRRCEFEYLLGWLTVPPAQ